MRPIQMKLITSVAPGVVKVTDVTPLYVTFTSDVPVVSLLAVQIGCEVYVPVKV